MPSDGRSPVCATCGHLRVQHRIVATDGAHRCDALHGERYWLWLAGKFRGAITCMCTRFVSIDGDADADTSGKGGNGGAADTV